MFFQHYKFSIKVVVVVIIAVFHFTFLNDRQGQFIQWHLFAPYHAVNTYSLLLQYGKPGNPTVDTCIFVLNLASQAFIYKSVASSILYSSPCIIEQFIIHDMYACLASAR